MREETREEERDDEVRGSGLLQRRAEIPREERRLERRSREERSRDGKRNARRGEDDGQDTRRERHTRALSRPRASHDRRLEPGVVERLKVDLGAQPVAGETRPGEPRDEQDRLHRGGRARCQREGAETPPKTARAHIVSDAKASEKDTDGISGG